MTDQMEFDKADYLDTTNMPPAERTEAIWQRLIERFPNQFYVHHENLIFVPGGTTSIIDDKRLLLLLDDARIVTMTGRADTPRADRAKPADRVAVLGAASRYLPRLRVFWKSPFLTPDLRLITAPGYDPESGVYLLSTGRVKQVSPELAQKILRKLLDGYSFVSASDKAHMLGLMLMPILRPAILGPTPLHMLTSPERGCGKTCAGQVTGTMMGDTTMRTLSTWSAEAERQLFEYLVDLPSMIFLDNIPREALVGASPSWLAFLTADGPVSSRRIGGGAARVEVSAVWVATSLTLPTSEEMARRMVPIRLMRRVPAPNEHPLNVLVRQRRAEALGALLTLLSPWIEAGCPVHGGGRELPSFDRWAALVGGAVEAIDPELGAAWLAPEHRPTSQVEQDVLTLSQHWLRMRQSETGPWPEWLSAAEIAERCSADGLNLESFAVEGRSGQTRVGRLLHRLTVEGKTLRGYQLTARRNRSGRQYSWQPVSLAQDSARRD